MWNQDTIISWKSFEMIKPNNKNIISVYLISGKNNFYIAYKLTSVHVATTAAKAYTLSLGIRWGCI